MTPALITGQAEVGAALADPRYQVPVAPPAPAGQTATLAWLRATVARFCEGEPHDRRRAIAERELATMDPARLRDRAEALARAELAARGDAPFDVMTLARRVPAAALAAELSVAAAGVADAVAAAAGGYLNPDQAGPDADAAVALLADALLTAGSGTGAAADQELIANRIGLLMQACDATAGLIGNALARAFRSAAAGPNHDADPDHAADHAAAEPDADELIAQTLRDDPPVRRARRVGPDGEPVLVDITAVPFGTGRRPCPGISQAKALAAGVLDALLPACVPADPGISYPDSPNLHIPDYVFARVGGVQGTGSGLAGSEPTGP